MNTAKIRIAEVGFSGTGEVGSSTIKLELKVCEVDTFTATELLPKILTDISSLSYEVD